MSVLEQARSRKLKSAMDEQNSVLDRARAHRNQDQNQVEFKPAPNRLKDLILGLGQFGIDTATGIPEQFKHYAQFKIGPSNPGSKALENFQENLPDRPSLEQYADETEGLSSFNVGRYGPDALALLYGSGKGIQSGANWLKKHTNKSIGNKIVNDANELQKGFNRDYDRVLYQADEELARVNPKPPPKINYEHDYHPDIPLNTKETVIKPGQKIIGKENMEKMKRGSDFETNVKIQDFLDDPTIDSAHWAKSSVNELLRDFENIDKSRGLKTTEKEARTAAKKVKKQIQDYMDEQFKLINPEYKKLYDQLTYDYLTEMGPYLQNRSIRGARKTPGKEGYIKPSRLPSKLYQEGGDPFMALMAERYPELKLNRFLSQPFTKKAIEKSIAEEL
jgi:hypothetical protein